MADGATLKNDDLLDIDRAELEEAISELADGKLAVSEATNALRSQIKTTLETTGWNKDALAIIRRIAAMSETKRADCLRTLLPMMDVMDAAIWADERADMLADPTEELGE